MKLKNLRGNLISKNISKYSIDWEGKSASKLQKRVKDFLKDYWAAKLIYEEFPVYGTRLRVDFVNLTDKVAVEVHGPQHDEFNAHFHAGSNIKFHQSIRRDVTKEKWLELNGFLLIEIYGEDISGLSREWFRERGIEL